MSLSLSPPPQPTSLPCSPERAAKFDSKEKVVAAPNDSISQDVKDYYLQTIEDYQTWSSKGYMHFGRWKPGINPLNRRAMLESMNDLVFSRLRLDQLEQGWIADLGCGVGAVSEYGSVHFPAHHFLGFSLSPAQVEYGQNLLTNRRVSLTVADYHQLPLADHSIDAAFFLESICHSPDLSGVLSEAARILKPGARLVIVDGLMKRPSHQTSRFAGWLSKMVSRNWAVPDFHRLSDVQSAADDAGFQVETIEDLSWQIAPSVLHSPALIAYQTLALALRGQLTSWKRRHLIACGLGMFLGLQRRDFGYYLITLRLSKQNQSAGAVRLPSTKVENQAI